MGDATKSAVFAEAGLLGRDALVVAGLAIPQMVVATFGGRRFNLASGERCYTILFWLVMAGYTARLLIGLAD